MKLSVTSYLYVLFTDQGNMLCYVSLCSLFKHFGCKYDNDEKAASIFWYCSQNH